MQYIDKTKIETYTVSPQAPSTSIVYNPSGTYNINQQVLTETQVILRYDLLLISSFLHKTFSNNDYRERKSCKKVCR